MRDIEFVKGFPVHGNYMICKIQDEMIYYNKFFCKRKVLYLFSYKKSLRVILSSVDHKTVIKL